MKGYMGFAAFYNGYDEQMFLPKDVQNQHFQITYLGKLYSTSLRDPRLLFAAIYELLTEGLIAQDDLRLLFHVDKAAKDQLHALAQEYHISHVVDVQGYIPRTQIVEVMHLSSILLGYLCLCLPPLALQRV